MNSGLGAFDDLGRGEADAVVNDVQPGVERAGGDLLGAVGMAVEARLADEKFDPAAELQRHALDLAAQGVEIARFLSRFQRNSGRGAELAEFGPQRVAPFAGGDAGLGRFDRRGHDVDAGGRGRTQSADRLADAALIARGAPGTERRDLLRLGPGRRNQDRTFACGERGGVRNSRRR